MRKVDPGLKAQLGNADTSFMGDDGSRRWWFAAALAVTLGAVAILAATVVTRASTESGEVFEGATLWLNTEDCRNEGHVDVGKYFWMLDAPVPTTWRGLTSVNGTVTAVNDGDEAEFVAEDGTTLRLDDFADLACDLWE